MITLSTRVSGGPGPVQSAHELRLLIAESATGGKLDHGEAEMLSGVFRLHEQQARQVMTPAPAIVTVKIDATD